MSETQSGSIESVQAAGGYGPPGGGGGWGPPPGAPPPGGGGYGPPPGGGGGYGGPSAPPGGGFGQPPGGFGGPGAPGGGYNAPGFGPPGMPVGGGGPQYHPMATTALVLGILSFVLTTCCCCFGGWSIPISIAAGVVGFLGLQQVKANPARFKGDIFCYIGIGAGAFGVICCILAFVTSVDEQLMQHRHF